MDKYFRRTESLLSCKLFESDLNINYEMVVMPEATCLVKAEIYNSLNDNLEVISTNEQGPSRMTYRMFRETTPELSGLEVKSKK